ncbi:MAG: hypothetical protein Q8R70_13135 [Methanoregula sp.]|nr:hypothetical protein [Methanoregula sp.]
MQLTAAVRGIGPIPGPVLSVVPPVLPSILIREITTDKPLPAQAGRATSPHAISRQDSVLATPGTLPVLPDTVKHSSEPAPATKSHPVAPPGIVRPRPSSVSRRISKSNPFIEQDIPLYLVPHIIARVIWQQGEQTFRISVIRTKQHYYTIRLRTARSPARKGTKPGAKSKAR